MLYYTKNLLCTCVCAVSCKIHKQDKNVCVKQALHRCVTVQAADIQDLWKCVCVHVHVCVIR